MIEHTILEGNYPDLITITPDKAGKIGIAAVQHLQEELSRSPYYSNGYRVVLIDNADRLTPEAQNCLLKTIEEPPNRTIMIFVAQELQSFIPTVLSRCKQVFFPHLSNTQVTDFLSEQGITTGVAEELAVMSKGLPGLAIDLAQNADANQYRKRLQTDAEVFIRGTLFERLTRAGKLGEQSDYAVALLQELARNFSLSLRKSSKVESVAAVASNLETIERALRSIAANVSPKATLEVLTLELIC
jgi:DNA polymerase-3 subunit delta'